MPKPINNTAIGSALIIPDGLINKLGEVDKKIRDIQDASRATANVFNNSFASMSMGLKTGILTQLQQVINQLGSVGQAAQTASSATQNMGSGLGTAAQGANNLGTSVTGVVEAINRMIGQLQQTGQVGSSSLMAAKLAADKLMVAMQFKYGQGNIAELKNSIRGINETLNDTERQLTRVEQQNLVELKRHLQDELKEAERTQNERAVNLQRVLDRMMRAEQSYQRQVEQARKKTAQEYQKQNYASNTTYSGSLSFADNANTINRRTQAIKYLTEARNALSKTDADYTNKLATLNAKIKELNAENRQAIASSQELNSSHRRLMDTAGQLQRAFALLFSVSQIRGYVNQIAKVRGEFELQQRSLEAILQNKTEADSIFNKTVALAVQSPFQIRELVSYTKQLAAYRIESGKLYDTTKRLADVSAGLGVDMQRLILAYGQVKAAAYLRGTEVRQFTEAGINLYGELQRYFQEVKGEAYTTAQIVDMISKRMVTFEDVEQIFKRITDQGGIFYRMQEIQAETLQGKIANFKDSVDVMMNEIGKYNEGLFKGAIDSATAILWHWEEIVYVGKALVGVFLLLKTYSVQTGVAMSKVFTVNMMANAANTLKFTELLHYGFLNLSKSVKILGANLKAAFVTNLPMLAITALGMAIYEAYDRISSYREAVAKSNEELVKARGAVADLTNEYNNLTTATNNAKNVQERNADPAKDIEARRNALQKLIDLAGKNGLTFEIKVAEVKDDELNAVFDGVKEKYERFLLDMAIIQKRHAENKSAKSWWFFSDAINEDANDYKNAVLEVLAQSDKLDTAISNVKTNYDNLSEASKKYYKEIAAGKKDGESEIDYYTRMYKAMLQINRLNVNTNTGVPKWLKATNTILKDISRDFKDIGTQAKEFTKELDDVLGDVIENARKRGATDIQIKPLIDKYASEQGFDDIQKDLAYRHFGINISINHDSVENETSWVDNYLTKFFEKKTYEIKFDITQPTGADAFDDLKKKRDDAVKAAKEWKEIEDIISSIGKNEKTVQLNSKLAGFINSSKPIFDVKAGEDFDVKALKDIVKEYKKVNADIAISFGTNPFEKQANKSAKSQRDILSEQISLLKEMQERYERLRKLMSDTDAAKNVKESFADALDFVKMPDSIVNSFVPSKEGLIKAYEKLLSSIPKTVENFKKRAELEKGIAKLKIEIDEEYLKTDVDNAKKEIESMFSGLDLYNKMKKEGFSDDLINALFGDLTTTEDEIKSKIEELAGKEGETWEKAYDEMNKKLKAKQDEMFKNRIEQYAQFIDDFNNQIENKQKEFEDYMKMARDMLGKTKDVRAFTEQVGNIIAKYNQDVAKIETEKFKKTGTYIEMMGDLSLKSADELEALIKKLEEFIAKSASNVPAETLKAYIDQLNKAQERLDDAKNPFGKTPIKEINDIINLQKEYNAEKERNNEILQRQAELEEQLNILQSLREDAAKKGADTTMLDDSIVNTQKLIKSNENSLANSSSILQGMSSKMGNMTGDMGVTMGIIEKIVKAVDDSIQGTVELFNEIKDIADSFGVDTEAAGWEDLSIAMGTISDMSTNVKSSWESFKSGDMIGASVSAFKAIGSIIKGINKLHDAKYEREIKRQQELIETLQRSYEKLKKSMDEAWSASDVINANSNIENNIKSQIASYEAMINAEQDKKKSDEGKINEWQNQIYDLKDTLKELEENAKEAFGGFGSEANYKSAAQEFADAWVDAFNESEDTLKALEDTFDNYFNNMLKKQLMQRAAQKYLKPIFDAFDKAVSEGSAGGNQGREVTEEEIARIQQLKDSQLKSFDEYAKALMKVLGIKPNGASTGELSKLQQGIQSLTESTGQALESLLNSIRFFVAQQSSDVSVIRSILQQSSNVDISSYAETPMLSELMAQTNILKNIYSKLDSVIRPSGHPKLGAGIKVFLD